MAYMREWGRESYIERERISSELGIPLEALERLRVGADSKGGFSTWPERDKYGKVIGVIRRYSDGSKKTLGTHGVYYEDSWSEHDGPVIIPEGGTDTACLIAMELSAIGRFSNTGGVNVIAEMLGKTRREVIVIAENDRKDGRCKKCDGCYFCWPGLMGAKTTCGQLLHLGFKASWSLLPCAKDVRDWTSKNGFDRELFLASLSRKGMHVEHTST